MGVSTSPLRDRVIFVTGSPRSGTTWVARVLRDHPQLAAAADESHLFDRGVGALFDNHESTAGWERWLAGFVSREELVDLVRDLCDGVLLRMREHTKPGASHVLEKTPIGGLIPRTELTRKLECYPDARYVHVIRDGRAVAHSLMRVPWGPASLSGAAEIWRRSVTDTREILSAAAHVLEVGYEELRADPAAGFAAILDWAGLPGDPAIGEALEATRDVALAAGFEGATLAPDRWRTELSDAEVASIERVVGGLLAELGYPPGVSAPGPAAGPLARDPETAVRALAEAIRDRNGASLDELTSDRMELRLRTGRETADVVGDEARAALLRLGGAVFAEPLPRAGWVITVDGEWGSIWHVGDRGGRPNDLGVLARVREGRVDLVVALALGGV